MSREDHTVAIRHIPASRVDMAIAAWLHAKTQHSHSDETHRAYEATLTRFRSLLLSTGLDLDASDPQVVEQQVLSDAQTPSTERPMLINQVLERNIAALALAAQGFAATPSVVQGHSQVPSPNTHNVRLAILSSFYTYALRQGLLHGANPLDRVERVKTQAYAQAHGLHQEHLVSKLTAIDRTTLAGQRDYALLIIGLYTGRRLSELAGMSREHVVLRKATLEIVWPRVKGGRTMRDTMARRGAQALPAQALMAWLTCIETLPEDVATALPVTYTGEQPIWISLARNGTYGHRLSLQAISAICASRLGTSKVHTLRHTFARALEDAGAKVSEIQARLGHASLDTTSRYLAQLRADENPHLAKLTALYGLKDHVADEDE
ncbi:MAG: site-specific integrase [Ktedonobacterales bacterium]|nr:site-specific integrase [Ktedonobacterales bacterium]